MRALVVGLGRMGGFHRRVLMDLGYDVWTVDPDPSAGADSLSTPAGWCSDVVCVAVPINQLAETAARFAGKTRSLLIEKPGARSCREARELADVLRGDHVGVGYVERFNPRVREVARVLENAPAVSVRFRRWNDRPSPSLALDLMAHDVDLARYLGIQCPVDFETAADRPMRIRDVAIRSSKGSTVVDLMAHDTSPLHAQWHAFLSGQTGCASLEDAQHVFHSLRVLEEAQRWSDGAVVA